MFRAPAMLLPHESTVLQHKDHIHHMRTEVKRDKNGVIIETVHSRINRNFVFKISSGQEPSHTHDMDDDDIDTMEDNDDSSEHSN